MSLGVKPRPMGTFDSELEFKDAGLIGASAAAQVDSAAKIVNVGTALFMGKMIIDVSALEIASNDEIFEIVIQGSSDSDFGTAGNICDLAILNLSAKEVKRTDSDKDDAAGRYKVYFDNESNGTYYQYLRVYTYVAGTIATGINYVAYCVPMQ